MEKELCLESFCKISLVGSMYVPVMYETDARLSGVFIYCFSPFSQNLSLNLELIDLHAPQSLDHKLG